MTNRRADRDKVNRRNWGRLRLLGAADENNPGSAGARGVGPLQFSAESAYTGAVFGARPAASTTEAWAQILEVIAQLQLAIEMYKHDQRVLELWAARERTTIEHERQRIRDERAAAGLPPEEPRGSIVEFPRGSSRSDERRQDHRF